MLETLDDACVLDCDDDNMFDRYFAVLYMRNGSCRFCNFNKLDYLLCAAGNIYDFWLIWLK